VKKAIQKKVLPKKSNATLPKSAAVHYKKNLFIAGIGASAGGLEALKLFFDNFPPDSGMAFVIVQHLDPTHKSLLTELIGMHTKMQVAEVTDGLKVKPNCVYIIPPNRDLRILHSTLKITEPTQGRTVRRPIDLFFQSLAQDQKDMAIGIILSGTGTEGTLGLKEIKAEGGISFVQDPKTAQFAGMPQSAITAATPDFILPPEKMPDQLIEYIKKRRNTIGIVPTPTASIENHLKKIFLIIRNQTGHDFSNYKINTILRRITKRIALNQINTIEDYEAFLQNNPAEIKKLYKDFLIGVTSFFRDKEVFDCVEKKAIPYLMANCLEKQVMRIWVCGCSTGEEAYSLAILFNEALVKTKQFIRVIIFATDIDKDAIDFARNGIYSESAVGDINPERLSNCFVHKENGVQLKKHIREMVVFAHHNVIKDPPFTKMDMISCRNLLIYLNTDLQKKIIPVFDYSLNKDGLLLLGTSESIGEFTNYFSVFDQGIKIFKKKKKITNRLQKGILGLPEIQHNMGLPLAPNTASAKKVNLSGLTEKILLNQYAPPSVIIDKNNEAIYFSGNIGQYLEIPVGEARLNILDMAKRGLKPELDATIRKVRTGRVEVQTKGVEVKVNDHFKAINLIVKPVLIKETDLGALLIIFEPAEKSTEKVSELNDRPTRKRKPEISDLEKELKITQQHLQSAINELEISNESLQTTNEEYQSSNEELQSTNEELETSREELQSVNEELITVNSELTDKIEQLSEANDDLNNLLASIEVATVYLDRELKVKRFTPAATRIFNLIPSDIDRPVTHLSSNIVYKTLVDDVKNALKTLAVKSADVKAVDGTWYHMRILPYRTTENIIEGVLVTFVDITDQKNVEETLKKTNEHINLILENLPAVPFTCIGEPEIIFSFVGKSSEKVTGFLPEQFISKTSFWINRIHADDKKKMLSAFLNISKKGSLDLLFRWKCADGKYKHFINYLRFAKAEGGRPAYIVGVWQETKGSEKQLKVIK
jgi:two-component system CheB/CheR fusion protein